MSDSVHIAALEAQLRAHPEDWDSWLVYSDWLTDRGDERGALIGLHHRLAAGDLSGDAAAALRFEIYTLERRCTSHLGLNVEWRHGFVVGLSLSAGNDVVSILERLQARPDCRLLADLALPYGSIDNAGVCALAASPALTTITSLDLRYNHLSCEALEALARSPHTLALTKLHLQRNDIRERGVSALAASESFRGLTTLDLRDNPIGALGASALARSPHLTTLERLILYLDDIGQEGARALADSPHLPLSLRRYWRAR